MKFVVLRRILKEATLCYYFSLPQLGKTITKSNFGYVTTTKYENQSVENKNKYIYKQFKSFFLTTDSTIPAPRVKPFSNSSFLVVVVVVSSNSTPTVQLLTGVAFQLQNKNS